MYWGAKGEDFKEDQTSKIMGMTDKDEKVELVNNRIYFYSGVSENSILMLNKNVQSLVIKAKIHAAHNDMSLQHSGSCFVNIQSFGGNVFAGLSGMDTILEARDVIPVNTIVDGCAASAATFLSIVGTRRYIRRNSYMLIHQLSSGMWGKYAEIKDEVTNLDMLMDSIRNMYGTYTKVPKTEIDKILKKDLWWDAKKCLKYGLVDEII